MAKSQLQAKKRDNTLNPRQTRSEGRLPATLYGKGMESLSIELDTKEFAQTYKKDKYAIFQLSVDNKNYNAIVKRVQMKSINDNYLNVEFLHVREDATLKITVPVKIIGESAAVKAGAELVVTMSEMEVECLPANIPHSIDIDISVLENYEDSLTVEQLQYPKGVKSTASPDMIVVKAMVPKAEAAAEGEAGEGTAEAASSEEA